MHIGFYNTTFRLGAGTFGEVWEANHIITGKMVAIKFELASNCTLRHEAEVLNALRKVKSAINVLSFRTDSKYSVLVLPRLGDTVHTRFTKCATLPTATKCALEIGMGMLNCIKDIHHAGFLHRDIKPDNFMFGVDEMSNRIYAIDFGLCVPFSKDENYVETKGRIGSPAFCSPFVDLTFKYTPRDDIMSWFYSIASLALSGLPWSVGPRGKRTLGSTVSQKRRFLDETLWEPPFNILITYIVANDFTELKNYDTLIELVKTILSELA